jgi:hypothetical protein
MSIVSQYNPPNLRGMIRSGVAAPAHRLRLAGSCHHLVAPGRLGCIQRFAAWASAMRSSSPAVIMIMPIDKLSLNIASTPA